MAAIRHLDGHELNNRRLRVSYSNNSNLKEVAQTISSEQIPDFSHLRPEFHAVSEIRKHNKQTYDLSASRIPILTIIVTLNNNYIIR